jgi:hypothetical protein
MQDENDTDWEINKDETEDPAEFTLSSDIEQDNLDNRQEVLYLDQVYCAKTL